MSDPFDPRDLQVIFLREMHEARVRARDALDRAGRDAGDPAAVRELRNFFHRLAGSAGTVGHGMLARLAGACELAADQELERKGPLSKIAIRIFAEGLGGVDDIDGFDVCRRVRANPALQLVPIIFVTRRGDVEERVRGLQVGGNDYVAKPFDAPELVARVRSHLSRLSALREMAIRDGLTRCYNHKYFKMRLEQEMVRAQRYGSALSLGLLDVDHFKQVNDTHGHPSGDAVLAHLASLLIASVRSSDIVARYGGEEFAFVLVEAGAQEAASVARRMRARVEAHEFEVAGAASLRATASIGLAEAQQQDSPAALVQRADAALYQAKAQGR